jgi:parallel beta-helix repeat protein
MKNEKTILLVIILLSPLLIVGNGIYSKTIQGNEENLNLDHAVVKAYDTHGPIRILNDTDFFNQATAESWPGDGSDETPFLIEGWNITASSEEGIYIQETSYHFIIQDCLITIDNGYTYDGISFYNVTNGAVLECEMYHFRTGIQGVFVDNLVVEGCVIYDCNWEGIHLTTADNIRISQCIIHDSGTGVIVEESMYSTIHGNNLYSNNAQGLIMAHTTMCNVTENIIFSNRNSGIYTSAAMFIRIEGNTISDNDFPLATCGINLEESDDATIISNHIENNTYCGIKLYDSQRPYIAGNIIANNSDLGIEGSVCDNVTIHENIITHNGWWSIEAPISPPILGGIVFGECQGWVISANEIWNNTQAGVALIDTILNLVADNDIYQNTDCGVYGLYGGNNTVLENDIWGNGWKQTGSMDVSGILISSSDSRYWTVQGNHIYENNWNGILNYGDYNNFIGNEVFDNQEDGIWIIEVYNCTVSDNIIYNNFLGLYMVTVGTEVIENIIYDNEVGIYLDYIGNNTLYGNDIGWNTRNAFDLSGGYSSYYNFWFNEDEEVGNWWSDYDGVSGTYNIYNDTGIVNTDLYPHQSLSLESAEPLEYEISSSGIMEWVAEARNPSYWILYIDDILNQDGEWNGGNIITAIDDIDAGLHNARLEIFHFSGHSINATSTINVTDQTPPTWIIAPSDQEIDEGEQLIVQFTAEDPSGIGGWAINDTANFHISETGLLTNNTILSIGDYGLRVIVEDTFGNDRDYEIRIRVLFVIPETTPTSSTTQNTSGTTTTTSSTTTPSPFDGTMLIVMVGIGGIAIVVIVIVIISKKR